MTTELARPRDAAKAWGCPSCFAVVRRLSEVRYELGLRSIGPIWRCDTCLEELRAAAAESEAAHVGSSDEYVWAVRVDRVVESPAAGGSEETLLAQPAPASTSRGGIEL